MWLHCTKLKQGEKRPVKPVETSSKPAETVDNGVKWSQPPAAAAAAAAAFFEDIYFLCRSLALKAMYDKT